MGIKRNVAILLTTGLSALVLAACSETPSTPGIPSAFAVGATPAPTPVAVVGVMVICKTGNAAGSFDVTRTDFGGASGGTAIGLNANIPAASCLEVANDNGPAGIGSMVTVDEDAAANTVQTVVSCSQAGQAGPPVACAFSDGGTLFLNSFHGYVIVYNNAFTPPPPPPESCTYTKGWYRNNGEDDVTAVDGRTADEARAIFDATPGKPGGVTFGGNNSLLNLYQQFLAALLNGGATGPQAVQDAIDDVAAGTGGSGLAITTTLTKDEISAATATLSSFNEGSFEGFPHCDDEVALVD
jgi:hypothetical protein